MEQRLVVRPRLWRQAPVLLILAFDLAIIVWVWLNARIDPGTGWGFVATLILISGVIVFESIWQRIVVTADQVRMVSAHRVSPVSRSQIFNIRALRWNTVFYDHDQKPILKTRADLSRSQLLTLGAELGVNVWDHRAWHGLKELDRGVRLNPEPFPHRPPA